MFEDLKLHLDSQCHAIREIAAEATRPRAGVLKLRYRITGDLSPPAPKPVTRADALWRHTCFEAFVRTGSPAGYAELNFSPSCEWAAYQFDSYRKGMRDFHGIAAPMIDIARRDDGFELTATLDLGSNLLPQAVWRLGLSAVIEETNGRLSYWALAHPPGKPDFHHEDCFMLELAAPSSP